MKLIDSDDNTDWYLEDESDIDFYPEHQQIAAENERNEYVFLCIDIGLINLGLSIITTDFEYNFKNVPGIELFNITNFSCDRKICKLGHDKICVDWVNHLIQYYQIAFDQCNHIIIERQPPSGLVAVEQLIMSRYRDKTTLIHPMSMHKFFHIGIYDYEERKKHTEKIALRYMKDVEIIDTFKKHKRKHDIADSICLGIFWLSIMKKEYDRHQIKVKNEEFFNLPNAFEGLSINEWFDKFQYEEKL